MKSVTWHHVLFAVCFTIGPQSLWAESASQRTLPKEHDMGADRFVAGCPISVERPVAGDLIAAGCDVDVLAEVAGDLVVMGGNLRLAAPVKQNLYAAGGKISIESDVQRNVRVGGGRVEIAPTAKIGGNVTIGGGEVEIDGAIGGYLEVGGGSVRINGPVAGDVEVGAGEVELGPNARIEGKLSYESGDEIERDPAAQVHGGVERIEREERWPAWQHASHDHGAGHGWLWSFCLLVIAAILAAALPYFYLGVAQTARTRWPLSLLLGFIVVVSVPVVAVLAIVTLIGIPLALALIALYFVLLLAGYVSAGIALGELALQRWDAARALSTGWRIVAAVLAVLGLSLAGRTPFVGSLITLAAVLTGIGVLLLQLQPAAAAGVAPRT
jgi:cytoskeletal protein CcmA (bactofilin family)